MDKVSRFIDITEQMNITYESKNNDYGDSFGESVKKYGLISALTRISDKFNRLESLILNQYQQVKGESLKDTLLDLACYSIMTIIELESPPKENIEGLIEKQFEEIEELKDTLQEKQDRVDYLDKELNGLYYQIESKDRIIDLYKKDLEVLKNQLAIEREKASEEDEWNDFIMY